MPFTDLHYVEFDTTQQNVMHDLRQAILGSASWSKISPTASLAALSAASSVGGQVLTFASGAVTSANMQVGDIIRIGESGAADMEVRTITSTTATTITFSNGSSANSFFSYPHPIGTNVYRGNEVLKATTTRGADMIIDLQGTTPSFYTQATKNSLQMVCWHSHTGTVGTGAVTRRLHWKSGQGVSASDPIHAVVSVSKDHLYFSLEGPRGGEFNPTSDGGSNKGSMFMSDIVPYHVNDSTPAVYAGGNWVNTTSMDVKEIWGNVSRDFEDNNTWVSAPLATLTVPILGSASFAPRFQQNTKHDENYYLFPYVVIEDGDGLRGRLAAFWHAGITEPDVHNFSGPDPSGVAVGSIVEYAGNRYKLHMPTKVMLTGGDWYSGNQFGVARLSPNVQYRGVLVAVPYED